MLSTMTTSDDIPLTRRSECSRTLYETTKSVRLLPKTSFRHCTPKKEDLFDVFGVAFDKNDFLYTKVPRSKPDMDFSFDWSNVLKLDFSKLANKIKKERAFGKSELSGVKTGSDHRSSLENYKTSKNLSEKVQNNPFVVEEDMFPPTNPFSPEPVPGRYASPAESWNPFLSNTTPELCHPVPGSFIFAVPVFPILTNSSTQTVDPNLEPAYQNQLRKLRNDHSERDVRCLKKTVKDLRNSGWYHENVSWQESVSLLNDSEPGTFLIRDSSDPNFLFSLSVQTTRGPTSVRIHYENGQFRLDAEKKIIPHLPFFNSVPELIDYYVESTVRDKLSCKTVPVWVDSEGNIYSSILLVRPLYRRNYFSSLQHLARLTINRLVRGAAFGVGSSQDGSFPNDAWGVLNTDDLPLPSGLLEYLREYPFCH